MAAAVNKKKRLGIYLVLVAKDTERGRLSPCRCQNNSKMLLKFCIMLESNFQNTFSAIVLSTNMAAVKSGAIKELRGMS